MKKIMLVMWLALVLIACTKKKDPEPAPPDLPPATEIGANTFGCYLNGVPWTPRTNSPYCLWCSPILDVNYEVAIGNDGPYFWVVATRENPDGKKQIIQISSGKLNRIGSYKILKTNAEASITLTSNYNYITPADNDVSLDGELIITKLDLGSTRAIISGKFHFKIQKGNDIFEAKDGRFDISF
ncbi:MAG: hypothetical protein EAZ44_09895 [Cytophagia bacterium]|nr:MAG: hypothetical protein EAZ44_09895 [Cytophagia bacterium]TAG45593.1 MAG: hypothetical protein EAZ31_01350 [Cytophagia bacterium]